MCLNLLLLLSPYWVASPTETYRPSGSSELTVGHSISIPVNSNMFAFSSMNHCGSLTQYYRHSQHVLHSEFSFNSKQGRDINWLYWIILLALWFKQHFDHVLSDSWVLKYFQYIANLFSYNMMNVLRHGCPSLASLLSTPGDKNLSFCASVPCVGCYMAHAGKNTTGLNCPFYSFLAFIHKVGWRVTE